MADRPRGFVPSWRPQEQTRQLLAQVELVLREYAEHLPLTVRQIFYRLVAAYLLEKSERSYGRLCETLVMARRAGAVPFSAIRDDGAPLPTPLGFDSAGDFVDVVRGSARRLHLDRQADLDGYTVVMAEASGMLPQLERVASNFSVPVIGSGGFASVTFAYALAQWAAALGRPVEVLHLGDHDPSGVHIFRSLAADVAAFAGELDAEVKFSRLAVTPEQAVAWNLPTAPAKATDGRSFEGVPATRGPACSARRSRPTSSPISCAARSPSASRRTSSPAWRRGKPRPAFASVARSTGWPPGSSGATRTVGALAAPPDCWPVFSIHSRVSYRSANQGALR